MRLAILTSHPVQYYAPLFRELAQRLDIHVFYAHRATAAQQAEAGFGVGFDWDLDLLTGYSSSFLTNVARNPGAGSFAGCDTPEIGARLREGGFDVLLTLGWHLKALLQGIWAAKRQRIPVLVRGDSQLRTPRSRLKRMAKEAAYPPLLRAFDAALYVGERNRAYFRHYRYPASRMFHSPHCVDTQRFAAAATPQARTALRARLGLAGDDRAVLFAGKLVPFKRPLDAVDATAQLRKSGTPTCLLVAGAGPLEPDMAARAAALSVPIHMLGFRNQTEMPAVYAAADVLLLPSTGRETWGLVCNEALACGLPIAVSDEAGCAPDLADGAAGRRYAMGDIAACAAVLDSILRAPPPSSAIKALSDAHSLAAAAGGIVRAAEAVIASPVLARRQRTS